MKKIGIGMLLCVMLFMTGCEKGETKIMKEALQEAVSDAAKDLGTKLEEAGAELEKELSEMGEAIEKSSANLENIVESTEENDNAVIKEK